MAPPNHANSARVILVVDDEMFLLEYVKLVLIRAGFDVLTAQTGEEAWQMVSNPDNSIGLVLTDVVMPGSFDGFELAERVRRRVGIPVLFMSGAYHHEHPNTDTLDSQGILLHKPFAPDELVAIVRNNFQSL
jgi:DNA-binding response OmpR family regulator